MEQPSDNRAWRWRVSCDPELGVMPGRRQQLSRGGPYRCHARCPALRSGERLWQGSGEAAADHMQPGDLDNPGSPRLSNSGATRPGVKVNSRKHLRRREQ
ncbi:hypothetical protein V8D89_013645 [Ganoderma adspersum]